MGNVELSSQTDSDQTQNEVTTLRVNLGDPKGMDDLIQYFDQLRINSLPVKARFNEDPEKPESVRVDLPLPISAIAASIDLKAICATIIELPEHATQD